MYFYNAVRKFKALYYSDNIMVFTLCSKCFFLIFLQKYSIQKIIEFSTNSIKHRKR